MSLADGTLIGLHLETFPFPGRYVNRVDYKFMSTWVKSAFHMNLMVNDCISDPYISPVGSFVFLRIQQITLAKSVLFYIITNNMQLLHISDLQAISYLDDSRGYGKIAHLVVDYPRLELLFDLFRFP